MISVLSLLDFSLEAELSIVLESKWNTYWPFLFQSWYASRGSMAAIFWQFNGYRSMCSFSSRKNEMFLLILFCQFFSYYLTLNCYFLISFILPVGARFFVYSGKFWAVPGNPPGFFNRSSFSETRSRSQCHVLNCWFSWNVKQNERVRRRETAVSSCSYRTTSEKK